MTFKPKDPSEVLDYEFDWTDVLAADETISSHEWTIEDGLTKDSQVDASKTSTVWVSGGDHGAFYSVTCAITTNGSRSFSRTAIIPVRTR